MGSNPYTTSVFYNGQDLSSINGLNIVNYETLDAPSRDLKINKLARSDKSILTSAEYVSKELRVYGRCAGSNKETTEAIYDQLKGYLQEPNKTLIVEQSNTLIQWTATLTSTSVKRYGGYLTFVLVFTASDPIGTDSTVSTLLTTTGATTTPLTSNILVEGSFKSEPYIVYTLSAVTGGTNATVTITNAETGQGITVTRTWSASDIMNIDCANKEIDVNGSSVEYSGSFPNWYPGTRSITTSDSFTTRTFDLTVTYNKKYT